MWALTSLAAAVAAGSTVSGALASQGDLGPPRWSPDGRTLAYERTGPRTRLPAIFDTHASRLVIHSTRSFYANGFAWSPDSSRIAFRNDSFHLFVRRADGKGRIRRIARTETNEFAWSPDGRRFAYTRGDPWTDLWLVGADGRGPARVDLGGPYLSFVACLAWSPNGSELAFGVQDVRPGVSVGYWPYLVHSLRLHDGSVERRSGSADAWCPTWMADGTLVYAGKEEIEGPFVYAGDWVTPFHATRPTVASTGVIAAISDKGVLAVFHVGDRRPSWSIEKAHSPVWSPDGRRLAFVRRGMVVVRDAAGANERVLGRGEQISWNRDSRRLAYLRPGCGVAAGIYVATVLGRVERAAITSACKRVNVG